MIAGKNFACRRPYSRANGFHHHPLLPAPFLRDKEYCTDNKVYINVHTYIAIAFTRYLITMEWNLTQGFSYVSMLRPFSFMWWRWRQPRKPTCGNQVIPQVPKPRVPREVAECQQSLHQTRDLGDPACLTGTPYIQQQASFFSFPSNKILGFHIKQCSKHIMPNPLSSSYALRYSCREMMLAWCKVMAHYTHGYHSAWVVLHM